MTDQTEAARLTDQLRNFAQGCRGSMWQSRDETIRLMDEAAARIAALEAELAAARRCPPSVEDMTRRFLTWPLPEDFSPDAGITFEPVMNAGTAYEHKHQPVGTNLLNYKQAKAMVKHITGAEGAADDTPARPSVAEAAKALLANCPNPIFDDLKPEMIGEIRVPITSVDEDGDEVSESIMLPWYTMKEVIHLALRTLAGEDGQ
ncbi:hypothetical protein [Sagittula sp. MA-2]|jgi:hypothetical protein|uniref:hypothetical protein n=1 Tax=Sagittula sp. MA-2 TaxID=3048007 RepID=UPI0024C2F469|nr:hypothetical protein [Sagittula sp. MA-2]WHZ33442.1 hypothetical protein QNI11_12345 [Sagittula sp. MA-2]